MLWTKNHFLYLLLSFLLFCVAEHFLKENVQQRKKQKERSKNLFAYKGAKYLARFLPGGTCLAKMHLMRTFCFAEHFPLENVRKNAFLHQMRFVHQQNVTNAFDAKMHLCQNHFCNATQRTANTIQNVRSMVAVQKCICNIWPCQMWCQNAVLVFFYFLLNIFFGKCSMQKCIFAKHTFYCALLNIFLCKMWCWTFYFVKCDAEHFPKENVRKNAFLHQMHFCTALLNIFLRKMYAKMHFGIKCIFASNAFLHQNAFLHSLLNIFLWKIDAEHFTKSNVMLNIFQRKMFSTNKIWCKNYFCKASNAFLHSWTFSFGKCDAEHFPLENVMLNILLRKMWCWTFSKGKCTQKCIFASNAFLHSVAEHFPSENVRQNAFCIKCMQNAFLHQMHFCIKCIFAQRCWTFSKGKCSAPTKCDAKIYFCKAYIFQRKMYTKMHLMQKCIFATQRTAEHFPLENVRQNTFCIKCILLTFCKQNVRAASLFFAKQKTQHFCIKYIFAPNTFLHQMHFGIKYIWCVHFV